MTSPADPHPRQVIALVPVQGKPLYRERLGGKPLLVHTLDAAKQSRLVERIIVSTEDPDLADLARGEGAEAPFLRPDELAGSDVPLERVLQHAVDSLEESEGRAVDVAVLLEVSHPFRPPGLIDRIVETLVNQDLDSVFVAFEETANFWFQDNRGLTPIGESGHAPRSARKPIYREISGMICATRGEVIKRGDRLGYRVGMVPIRGISGRVDVRSKLDLEIAESLLPAWTAALERDGKGGGGGGLNPKALLREARFIGKAYAYLPVTFWKRGVFGRDPYFRRFFRSRWGFLPKGLGELARRRRPTVWIEALSGGENTQIVTLINRLREMCPDVNLVLSTNNRYSFEFSRKREALDFVFDSPWDLRNVVRRVIRTLQPRVLIFIENMSYPVLCREAQRAGVRTVLLSGFMSHGYEAHEIVARSIPRRFHRFLDRIGVKSEADAEGYRRLGADTEKVKVVGEMKYDLEFLRLSDGERRGMRRTLGIPPDAPVFVAGSVRAGEDDVILEAFRRVREHHPGFRLLMAPSYYSNTLKLDEVFSKAGLDYQMQTALDAGEAPRDAVIIVDTFGGLGRLYGIGTVNFVGASIVPKGRLAFGHNPIEPLVHSRPLLFGPHMNHWGEITEVLLAADPGLQVRTGEEMAATILRLLRDEGAMRRVCLAADQVVAPNAGAVEKNLAFAREALAEVGIEARDAAALPKAVSG